MELEDQLTAIHEAGHAVIAWALGVRLLDATIAHGHSEVRHLPFHLSLDADNSFSTDFDEARKKALVALGGRVAEKALLELNGQEPTSYFDEWDMAEVTDLAERLFSDDHLSASDWISAREREADGIIVQHYDRVEALALALLKAISLTGDEIRAILGDRASNVTSLED